MGTDGFGRGTLATVRSPSDCAGPATALTPSLSRLFRTAMTLTRLLRRVRVIAVLKSRERDGVNAVAGPAQSLGERTVASVPRPNPSVPMRPPKSANHHRHRLRQ